MCVCVRFVCNMCVFWLCVCQCMLFCTRSAKEYSVFLILFVYVSVCVCVAKKGAGRKEDRRVEKKSNHLIAAFFISIFCFMAAEGRRATLAVIHGRSGGPWAAPSLIGTRPPVCPKRPHNYRDEYDLFVFCFFLHSFTLLPSSGFSGGGRGGCLMQPLSCQK